MAEDAARELVRVSRVGGLILLSVQSPQNHFLPEIVRLVRANGLEAVNQAILHNQQLPDETGIPWRAFSHEQVELLAQQLNCEVAFISASNVLATIHDIPLLEQIESDNAFWQAFLNWEQHLAIQRGNTEHGSHMIAVLRKRDA
jgi:hypothetical protein